MLIMKSIGTNNNEEKYKDHKKEEMIITIKNQALFIRF